MSVRAHVRVKTRWRYIFELGEIRWIVCSIAPALPIFLKVHLWAGGYQVDRLLYHPSSVDFLNDPQIHCSAVQIQIIMHTMPITVGSFGQKCVLSTQKGSCVIYLSQHHISSYHLVIHGDNMNNALRFKIKIKITINFRYNLDPPLV
jgi:hypothetical protein